MVEPNIGIIEHIRSGLDEIIYIALTIIKKAPYSIRTQVSNLNHIRLLTGNE